ncbi:FAS1 domain-containing protein SELMODRAFT_448915 [Selaginella moellendorffii]|uniref:FAS1 domain-containing protein SELMODRAFT_448915 n=1 Tax=Selaginella moellendorffii TaxID=88036 RepID=UPI000D1CE76E|nr:FAS1 domain-containing protein SELMODRAFT_448915 [Selaginella moellendorffii]|eukprot:XP_024517202.1 FAS1 domain-containing protein SELMODRAFT_448915 [Selaginella moellendorffii]
MRSSKQTLIFRINHRHNLELLECSSLHSSDGALHACMRRTGRSYKPLLSQLKDHHLPVHPSSRVERAMESRTLLVLLFVGVVTIVSSGLERAAAQDDTDDGILPSSDVQPLVSNMIGQGFTVAAAVAQSLQTLIPIRSTLLIPSNNAIAGVDANLSQEDIINTLQYHVLTFPTSFEALSRNDVGAELPTMLQGEMITVTSNSPGNFTLNEVNITHPDVCSSTRFIACHGIDRVLAYNSSLVTAAGPEASPPFGAEQASPAPEALPPGTQSPNNTANPSNRKSNSTSGVSLRHSFTSGVAFIEVLAASWLLM